MRLNKSLKLIEQIASKFYLPKTIVETAKKLFTIAKGIPKNFVQGRQTKHVAAVVLYISCRYHKKPYLLIDFADALHTSLYSLGSIYIKLIKKIKTGVAGLGKFQLERVDPSLFIHRFCAKLDFGEKTKTVATTALRMLQSMRRDWIVSGRRPAGLYGAAILISSRYHGFTHSTHKIVKVVKACHETIRKRLEEFKETKYAQLPMQEFEALQTSQLEANDAHGMDPPAFVRKILKKSKTLKSIGNIEDQMSIGKLCHLTH